MEVITSKKCSVCLDVLPMRDFRFDTRRMAYRADCRYCEADAKVPSRRRRAASTAQRKWTDDEVATLRRVYPVGGSAAAVAELPERTLAQVKSAAKRFRLSYEGPRLGGTPPKEEEPWGVPAHEYCEADIALRKWTVLVSDGTFAPNVGLVVGRAA